MSDNHETSTWTQQELYQRAPVSVSDPDRTGWNLHIRADALQFYLRQDTAFLFEGHDPSCFRQFSSEHPSVARPLQAVAASMLLSSALKKLRPVESKHQDAAALDKFLACNRKCETWVSDYSRDLFLPYLVGHFREEVAKFWEGRPGDSLLVDSFDEILRQGYFGPGESRGARSSDFYSKAFDSTLTATSPDLVRLWARHIHSFPLWRVAEFIRQCHGNTEEVLCGSKISFVPKNDRISRTIAVEPSLNTWFQLGLGGIIGARLRRYYGIDITSQADVNRELAKIGSITGKIATIDLESASDSISWRMVDKLFPKGFTALLIQLRSPTIETPQGVLPMNILSSMGNGYTFPLQTLIFTCAILACNRYLGIRDLRAGKTWSVFGDDIAVSNVIVAPLLSLLNYLGFTVNSEKSFFEGPFRESCGRDFFRGSDVRGVYIKSLQTQQDVLVAINRLQRWSHINKIALPATFRCLRGMLKGKPFFVPLWEADTAGVKVPVRYARSLKRGHSWRYKRYEFCPEQLTFHVGLVSHPRYGDRPVNPEGQYIAYLGGHVEQGRSSVRHDGSGFYRTRTRKTPNWEYASPTFVAEVGQLVWPERPDDFQWIDSIGARNLNGF